jgi:DNA ligase-1
LKQFAELVTQLDQTTKTNTKLAALVEYFDAAPDDDKVWAIAILSHRRPKRPINTTMLKNWAIELSGIPQWLFEESYHIVGDLAETITLLLPKKTKENNNTLSNWIQFLIDLRAVDSEEEQKQQVQQAWLSLEKDERFVFNKLITGGFRIGVSQNLMVRALAKHNGMDTNVVAYRLMGNWNPAEISYSDLMAVDSSDDISKPYNFYLAYPLEDEPESLGKPDEWFAERKWDGIRGQLIVRKDELFLWSRGEELVTDKFPELHKLTKQLPNGTVIDAEIMCHDGEKPLPFNLLQTRIGRKNVSKKTIEKAPVALMAYDLLEHEGKDIRQLPMQQRREYLKQVIKGVGYPMLLSPLVEFSQWKELVEVREQSREHFSEGLMIKRKNSEYKTGRKRGDWWKWKIDPMSIDAVMIYAQRGHGRRANLYSDYTFAVWDGDNLVPFTKAYSGLTDKEMLAVDKFVKQNTIERFGPVRSVTPELVFEIGFEGIQKSPRHKSGVALRFPRMLRWRTDKPAKEANTLEDLKAILDWYNVES